MTSPISGISIPSFSALTGTAGVAAAGTAPAAGTGDGGFADVLAGSVDQLQNLQSTSNALAVQAATGDLKDVHDYMIAAQEASLATEMVVTIKNKAVEAFTEIMRMPI
ncbi:flagellar hook-basal body complex protein FliE [Blastococcus sp. SYSU D00820]